MYHHLVDEIDHTVRHPRLKVGRLIGTTTCPTVGSCQRSDCKTCSCAN